MTVPTPLHRTASLPARVGLACLVCLVSLLGASCGDDGAASGPPPDGTDGAGASTTDVPAVTTTDASTTTTTTTIGDDGDPAAEMVDRGRVVLLAEEATLADVLALGVTVTASSATVPDVGFQGMGDLDTSGIRIYDYLDTSLEELAAMEPDHLVAFRFAVDQVGRDLLESLDGELHVIPDGLTTRERVLLLGEFFDREERAADLVAELDDAREAARAEVPEDCRVSVAAIYAGANVAAFAEPVWAVPTALDSIGCALVPSGDDVETDSNGRFWLSLELLGVLDAPRLILLQTATVEGEQDAIDQIAANPLWQQLPAVVEGRVTQLDRLGYPGVLGEIRLVGDVLDVVAG